MICVFFYQLTIMVFVQHYLAHILISAQKEDITYGNKKNLKHMSHSIDHDKHFQFWFSTFSAWLNKPILHTQYTQHNIFGIEKKPWEKPLKDFWCFGFLTLLFVSLILNGSDFILSNCIFIETSKGWAFFCSQYTHFILCQA